MPKNAYKERLQHVAGGLQLRNTDLDNSDMDEASMLEEMKDLAMMADEQTRSSPPEPPASAVQDAPPPSLPSSRASRSSSRSSHRGEYEKMQVFRDETKSNTLRKVAKDCESIKQPLAPPEKMRSNTKVPGHARSKPDNIVKPAMLPSPLQFLHPTHKEIDVDTHGRRSKSHRIDPPCSRLDIIPRLQDIARERHTLLEQLHALGLEEASFLSTLAIIELQSVPRESLIPLIESLPTTSSRTLSVRTKAPALPIPINDEPSRQPRKASPSKTLVPRPVSAPPKSTPSIEQQRTPSTSKRVPLTDKTESSLANFDSTPLYATEEWDVSPVKDTLELPAIDLNLWPAKGSLLPCKIEISPPREKSFLASHTQKSVPRASKFTHVPTKMSDETMDDHFEELASHEDSSLMCRSEQVEPTTPRLNIKSLGGLCAHKTTHVPTKFGDETMKNDRTCSTRPSTPSARSTKRGGPSSTSSNKPVTPGLSKYYEVPNTVKRKGWDF